MGGRDASDAFHKWHSSLKTWGPLKKMINYETAITCMLCIWLLPAASESHKTGLVNPQNDFFDEKFGNHHPNTIMPQGHKAALPGVKRCKGQSGPYCHHIRQQQTQAVIKGVHRKRRTNGDSGRTRTPNLLIRSQLLYPVELRNRFDNATGCAGFSPLCPDAFCQ